MRGRPPLPRRALLAATLGALYALLLLPAPGTTLGISLPGVSWFLFSASLLFLTPLAYHAYNFWGIVWVVWRVVVWWRAEAPPPAWSLALDVALPLVSVALLMTSQYLVVAKAGRAA